MHNNQIDRYIISENVEVEILKDEFVWMYWNCSMSLTKECARR